jgi:hypothetical protein
MQKPSPKTHVIVGDHTPEPRVKHEPFNYTGAVSGPRLCATHAPDPDDRYVVPASATHGPR